MIIGNVDREMVPYGILRYRELVDDWNSFNNKKITNELIDEMMNLYAKIKIQEHSHMFDRQFLEETLGNGERYKLKKYNFITK